MTQAELETLFADYGTIISSKILSNPKAGSFEINENIDQIDFFSFILRCIEKCRIYSF